MSMTAPTDPPHEDLLAAIQRGARKAEILDQFGLTAQRLAELQARWQLPKFKPGPPKGSLYNAAWQPPREKTPLDRQCDRAVKRRRRSTLLYGFLILEWCARQQPVRAPVGQILGDKWRAHALCRGLDPALFGHPDTRRPGWAKDVAKTVCAACPVRDVCPFREASAAERAA